MKKSFRTICFFFFLVSSNYIFCDNTIDSLQRALKSADQDTTRISILISLSNELAGEQPERSLEYAREAVGLAKNHKEYLHKGYNCLATAQEYLGQYNEALNSYFTSLKSLEDKSIKDRDIFIGRNYDCIAGIYTLQKNYNKAIEYRKQALKIFETVSDKSWLAMVTTNLGNVYYYMGNFDGAIPAYDRAAKIFKELNDERSFSTVTNNLGAIYHEQGKYKEALSYFINAYKANLITDAQDDIATSLNNIGEAYGKLGLLDSAITYCRKSLEISEKSNFKSLMVPAYENLANMYEALSDHKNALHFQRLYSSVKDSIYNEESSKQFHEMSVKYETDKKEKENQLLNQTIKIKEVESSRQQLVILLIGTILLVLGFVAFVLVKQNRLKNKINQQLAEKNKIIEDQHKDIKDSIHYSKRIQEAILPPMPLWHEALPDSFVIYKPKDILSGDFYWMEKVKNTVYFAAADCTGHGVPGAMVSVVCSTALNRAVKEFNLTEPGQILDKVRDLVLETFEKSERDVKDGMDISLVSIDQPSDSSLRTIKWSGANNPLWYLHDGHPREITADKQPVGKIDNPQPFTTHSINLQKGDLIYVFTDGYADQFGGLKGKKLKYKAFRDTILANIHLDLKSQKKNIEHAFDQWKGPLEQVDDVCVIGVRV